MKFRFLKSTLLISMIFLGGVIANEFRVINLDSLSCSENEFQYINKELSCSRSLVVKKQGYTDLKGRINDFIQTKIKENEVNHISIYFRDLEYGPTLGINEHSYFSPASLLKVPVLITYLSLAEDEPELLNKKLKFATVKDKVNFEQRIHPRDSIKENETYTIEELLRYMIVYSDNNAYFTLIQYLSQFYGDSFSETVKSLGVVEPTKSSDEIITVKSYASLFVQLFNATFLRDKESAERALALLSETDYKDGLVAGVPSGVRVAHKFGERVLEGNIRQFQDCGIVYYPDNPYLLCVMVRGQDINKLQEAIRVISEMVYEEFDSRKI